MLNVAVLDDYQGLAKGFADWDSLGGDVDVSFFREALRGDALVSALKNFEVLVLMRERTAFPREVLERLPNLRYVITTGGRNAAVDSTYLAERGIPFSGTQGKTVAVPVGLPPPDEVAWSLIFALAKRVVAEDRATRAGAWQTSMPTSIAGSTLGLAGLGYLGSAMVATAKVLGMDVLAWSQNLTTERAEEVGATLVSKEDLLARADFLSIHLVLSKRTRNLFGAAELAQMKSSAYLVNTSRGPIVNEAALVEALRAGTIRGAGLDVYDIEPLPKGHPFTELDNVVMLPHLGYVLEEGLRSMWGQTVENISAYLSGAPIRLIVGGKGLNQ